MGRVLATTVVLMDEEQQKPIVLLAGSEPTAAQAKLIDNPKAWGDESDDARDASVVTPDVTVVEPPADPADPEPPAGDPAPVEDEAPKASANKAAWVEYAGTKGVELGPDATKQDYIDAVNAL